MPLFSVIIPSYNRANLIEATLDSVLGNDLEDYEIIVADDGSKDGTPAIVEAYVQKHPDKVKLLVQKNKGEGAARNLAISHATGEYLAYLDSDDLYFPWALSTFKRAIEDFNRPASIAGFARSFVDEAELLPVKPGEFKAQAHPDLFHFMGLTNDTFPPSAAVMRRDVVNRAGGFQELHINSVDVDLWLRIGEEKGFVRLFSPLVTARREHASNVSGNKEMMINGAANLIAREKNGTYPGGAARQRDRLEFLLFHLRWMMVQCVRSGRQRAGWDMYRACFGWHVRLRRFRLLFGFPLLSVVQSVKRRG